MVSAHLRAQPMPTKMMTRQMASPTTAIVTIATTNNNTVIDLVNTIKWIHYVDFMPSDVTSASSLSC